MWALWALIKNRFMKAPVATAWVTAADIGGGDGETTGQDIVRSAAMTHMIHNLPDIADIPIWEVQATVTKTGGSGYAMGWVRLEYAAFSEASERGGGHSIAFYGGHARGDQVRRWFYRPIGLGAGAATTAPDRINVQVEGNGSADDTVWTVTDIKSRLIYKPL